MRVILLPTDFSKNSINAIDYAVDLFKDVICRFYILNIQKASSFISDDLRTATPSTTLYQSLIAENKTAINEIIIKLESRRNENHNFDAMVDYDNFIDAINQACSTKEADLIVMGTKGATGSKKVLFGSNTAKVMQRGSVPVLAVPENCKFSGLDKIGFVTNHQFAYSHHELTPLMQLAELFKSRIDVLHMREEDDPSPEQLENKSFLERCFQFVEHNFIELEKSELFEAVNNYIKDQNIDMLAMMSRKHSFFDRLFVKHNLKTFAFNIEIPFLVMENQA